MNNAVDTGRAYLRMRSSRDTRQVVRYFRCVLYAPMRTPIFPEQENMCDFLWDIRFAVNITTGEANIAVLIFFYQQTKIAP